MGASRKYCNRRRDQSKQARREMRKYVRSEIVRALQVSRPNTLIGFRVHPQHGWCENTLNEFGFTIAYKEGKRADLHMPSYMFAPEGFRPVAQLTVQARMKS